MILCIKLYINNGYNGYCLSTIAWCQHSAKFEVISRKINIFYYYISAIILYKLLEFLILCIILSIQQS